MYLSTHINDPFSKSASAVIITKDVEAWLVAFGAGGVVGFSSIKQSAEMRQVFMEIFLISFIPMCYSFLYSPEIQQLCMIFISGS